MHNKYYNMDASGPSVLWKYILFLVSGLKYTKFILIYKIIAGKWE